ncbi:hypothetical protein [Streptacidiphilus cavernicola]|uniref:Uncharacterized protein n=1 Tax=Streptacidiphilus cavernicola TaxID=3342716 RepID=A0ABV6VZ45_9ACTN
MTGPVDAADAVDALAGWRLRPGVAVTPLRDGIHLRGRRSNVTLEGSRALPGLWRLLDELLRTGDRTALLRDAPVGSPVRAALGMLVGHLRAHDLLVEPVADDGSDAVRWLRAVADRPDAVAAAIASARLEVLGAEPGGALAQAAGRALTRGGAAPGYVAAEGAPGRILLVCSSPDGGRGADGGPGRTSGAGGTGGAGGLDGNGSRPGGTGARLAVAAGVSGGTAFVTAPGSPEQARADAAALTLRLGLERTALDDDGAGSAVLTTLVAGAAAQRLLCAVAGMLDPASEGDDRRTLPDRPSVLVATARPLQSGYHCWLGPDLLDLDRAAVVAPPDTLAEALRRAAALSDEVVGALAPALPGALPQLPVALAACPLPGGGTLTAAAARVDMARLDAICRAAELRLSGAESAVSVGVDPGHAQGRALRRAAVRLPVPSGSTALPQEARLSPHRQARHWWSTLTGRLGVAAELTVVPVGVDGSAFRAVVRDGSDRLLGDAVEATPGDAAAFAALAATAHVHCAAVDVTPGQLSLPTGSSAGIASAGAVFAGWEDDGWTVKWLADVASRERELQAALRQLTGLHAVPWAPGGTGDADARAVAAALHGCGFTVLRTTGGSR